MRIGLYHAYKFCPSSYSFKNRPDCRGGFQTQILRCRTAWNISAARLICSIFSYTVCKAYWDCLCQSLVGRPCAYARRSTANVSRTSSGRKHESFDCSTHTRRNADQTQFTRGDKSHGTISGKILGVPQSLMVYDFCLPLVIARSTCGAEHRKAVPYGMGQPTVSRILVRYLRASLLTLSQCSASSRQATLHMAPVSFPSVDAVSLCMFGL